MSYKAVIKLAHFFETKYAQEWSQEGEERETSPHTPLALTCANLKNMLIGFNQFQKDPNIPKMISDMQNLQNVFNSVSDVRNTKLWFRSAINTGNQILAYLQKLPPNPQARASNQKPPIHIVQEYLQQMGAAEKDYLQKNR